MAAEGREVASGGAGAAGEGKRAGQRDGGSGRKGEKAAGMTAAAGEGERAGRRDGGDGRKGPAEAELAAEVSLSSVLRCAGMSSLPL